ITANDLVLNLIDRFSTQQLTDGQKMRAALKVSHIVLVLIAILTFFVALNPPKLLGIYGQVGVYGLVLAAVPPLLNGVLFKNSNLRLVWALSLLGIIIHFGLYFFGKDLFPESTLAFGNPGVTAAIALLLSALPGLIIQFTGTRRTVDGPRHAG
ncbi:MAG: hypothetical protein KDD15_01470, partial [Lewinella sp.]|nr:hypothetical protein [Lewinella sp.]